MTAKKQTLHFKSAIPDGNCAFNAFALSFRAVVLSGALDDKADVKYKDFLDQFPEANTWAVFKDYLAKTESAALQTRLASLFRSLAIKQLENKTTLHAQHHQDSTFQAIVSPAFRNVVLNKGMAGDDISTAAMIAKYHELKTKIKVISDVEAKIAKIQATQLAQWWKSEGHAQFLAKMKEETVWTGDLELAPLAEYFGINLKVIKPDGMGHAIHIAYGCFDPKKYNLEITELMRRLNLFEGAPLPSGMHRWFEVDDVEKKISEFEQENGRIDKEITQKIITCWKETYRAAPEMTLQHNGQSHWDALVPVVTAKTKTVSAKSESAVMREHEQVKAARAKLFSSAEILKELLGVENINSMLQLRKEPLKEGEYFYTVHEKTADAPEQGIIVSKKNQEALDNQLVRMIRNN